MTGDGRPASARDHPAPTQRRPASPGASPPPPAGDDAGRIRDSLAAWLAGVTFLDRTADQVSALLVDAVVRWGRDQGWRVYRRAASVFPLPPPYQHQHSWVDAACARADGAPVVIEVDRGARRRTAEKLLAEAAAGRTAIWVRWGERAIDPASAPVPLVGVRVTGRRAVGGDRLYSRTPDPDRPPPAHTGPALSGGEQVDLFEAPG
ncbi:hypothetical protein [Plantactinospora sp. GCM10030261]|uniref:hypothetical protein n=1 Tax=Plantactinospora sp. GCM10030261 TaxID=3273420 RepID=UPI00361A94DF